MELGCTLVGFLFNYLLISKCSYILGYKMKSWTYLVPNLTTLDSKPRHLLMTTCPRQLSEASAFTAKKVEENRGRHWAIPIKAWSNWDKGPPHVCPWRLSNPNPCWVPRLLGKHCNNGILHAHAFLFIFYQVSQKVWCSKLVLMVVAEKKAINGSGWSCLFRAPSHLETDAYLPLHSDPHLSTHCKWAFLFLCAEINVCGILMSLWPRECCSLCIECFFHWSSKWGKG